LAREQELLAA